MKCKRCGKCCRFLIFPLVDTVLVREFLDARGIEWTEDLGCLDARVPHVCPHLTDDGCDIHDDGKPVACKDFPVKGQRCCYEDS